MQITKAQNTKTKKNGTVQTVETNEIQNSGQHQTDEILLKKSASKLLIDKNMCFGIMGLVSW